MYRIHRFPYNYFLENPAPEPHEGWTLEAFQEYCHSVLLEEGFVLSRPMKCKWDGRTREIVFVQEPSDLLSTSIN